VSHTKDIFRSNHVVHVCQAVLVSPSYVIVINHDLCIYM